MKNILKIALVLISASILSVGTVSAKDTIIEGFVTSVKVNNIGPSCTMVLGKTQHAEDKLLTGLWDCSSLAGQSMLELAKFAKWQGLRLSVMFEDNGKSELENVKVKTIEWIR